MNKTLISILSLLVLQPAWAAQPGSVDFEKIGVNYNDSCSSNKLMSQILLSSGLSNGRKFSIGRKIQEDEVDGACYQGTKTNSGVCFKGLRTETHAGKLTVRFQSLTRIEYRNELGYGGPTWEFDGAGCHPIKYKGRSGERTVSECENLIGNYISGNSINSSNFRITDNQVSGALGFSQSIPAKFCSPHSSLNSDQQKGEIGAKIRAIRFLNECVENFPQLEEPEFFIKPLRSVSPVDTGR